MKSIISALCMFNLLFVCGCRREPPIPADKIEAQELEAKKKRIIKRAPQEDLTWEESDSNAEVDPGLIFDGPVLAVMTQPLPGLSQFTVEAWITSTNANPKHSQTIISNTERSGFSLKIDSKMLPRFDLRLPDRYIQLAAKQPIPTYQRTHLSATIDRQRLRLFVNGTLSGELDFEEDRVTSSIPICIGANPDPHGKNLLFRHRFIGAIHQCRISKAVLYFENFTPAESLEADEQTIALYDFKIDRKMETVVSDLSGNRRHGEIIEGENVIYSD